MGNSTASNPYSTAFGLSTASNSYATALGNSTASGQYSTASGRNTLASGNYSIAMGQNSTASGELSTALGNSTASNTYSTALGRSNASASGATAVGGSTASGFFSFASGNASTASGAYSTASGTSTASADNSTALGESTASGAFSTALGRSVASGTKSLAAGDGLASGYGSSAFGQGTVATSLFCTAVGYYNDPIVATAQNPVTPPDLLSLSYVSPLFIVGAGYINSSGQIVRRNALMIDQYGETKLTGNLFVPNVFATNVYTSSDRNFKRDFTPLSNALDKVLKINGMNYYWKDTTERGSRLQSGIIAQEVQAVMPELVHTDDKGMLSVNYQGITPYLIESIKILKKENDDLKQQVATLHLQEQRITDLEKQAADFKALKADMENLKAALQSTIGKQATPFPKESGFRTSTVKTTETERK
jgi:Chaperone of endosialidase/Head domain of trimeric autotransporter adhesin